jgi:hypothetical protein
MLPNIHRNRKSEIRQYNLKTAPHPALSPAGKGFQTLNFRFFGYSLSLIQIIAKRQSVIHRAASFYNPVLR